MISVGLSLTSTLIIIHVVVNGVDQEMLTLAAVCGFLVAIYQIISLAIGYKVLSPKNVGASQTIASTSELGANPPASLKAADTQEFIKPNSVVEDTTDLLEPIPRSQSKAGTK
jgi:hypothetical protein